MSDQVKFFDANGVIVGSWAIRDRRPLLLHLRARGPRATHVHLVSPERAEKMAGELGGSLRRMFLVREFVYDPKTKRYLERRSRIRVRR